LKVRTLRRIWIGACLVLTAAACRGSSEMSLNEYVEGVDAIFARGVGQYEELVSTQQGLVLVVGQGSHLGIEDQGAQLTDFTPQDLHVALEQVARIQSEALQAAAAMNPPEQIVDLHALFFRELPIAELAARAGTASNWEELSASAEMDAYRKALAADNQACADFQAKLDRTADRGVFADTPWIPNDLKETVNYALGCDELPAHPEDAYRPTPTTAP
jgi:hypothetical protein